MRPRTTNNRTGCARYRYVHVETTRHGRTIYYLAKPNMRKMRLPDDPESREFYDAYWLGMNEGCAFPRPAQQTANRRSVQHFRQVGKRDD